MPRPLRIYPAGVLQHVYNRGNHRRPIFRERADFLGFLAALALAAERTTVRLVAFCLMTNHWHLMLWPALDQEISAYMQILMNAHIRDLLRRRQSTGNGHIYGGRHKNVPILTERQYWIACRYVEGNALKAGMVDRAEDWAWSSVSSSEACEGLTCTRPLPRPAQWLELVNNIPSNGVLKEWRTEARRAQKAGTMGQFVIPV